MSKSHVRVRVGAESYAVPVDCVLEVASFDHVSPLPGAHPSVIGLCNLHGRVLPVINVARMLGVDRDSAPARLVVAQDRDRLACLAVDAVTDVELLPAAAEEVGTLQLAGAALVDGALVGAIDVVAMFDAVEQARAC